MNSGFITAQKLHCPCSVYRVDKPAHVLSSIPLVCRSEYVHICCATNDTNYWFVLSAYLIYTLIPCSTEVFTGIAEITWI